MSLEQPQLWINKSSLKIIYSKFHSNLPGFIESWTALLSESRGCVELNKMEMVLWHTHPTVLSTNYFGWIMINLFNGPAVQFTYMLFCIMPHQYIFHSINTFWQYLLLQFGHPIQLRHGLLSVSFHRPLDCLFKRLNNFSRNKTLSTPITGRLRGIDSPQNWSVMRTMSFHYYSYVLLYAISCYTEIPPKKNSVALDYDLRS